MRALVTGGAGFIGSHLVDAALSRGWRVRVLDNLSTGARRNLAHALSDVDFIDGDVRDPETVLVAVADCEIIFHQAGVSSVPGSFADPHMAYQVNAEGTLHVLSAARTYAVRRVILASSSSVYGKQQHLPLHEDLRPLPMSPYGASKLAAEALALAMSSSTDIEVVALRYFNVYGPRQRARGFRVALVPAVMMRLLSDEAPIVFGDGKQTRDFTFVADVVTANMLAAQASTNSGAYNVGTGQARAVNEVVNVLASLLDRPNHVVHHPTRMGEVHQTRADLTLARETFGYRPTCDLHAGLATCVSAWRGSSPGPLARQRT